MSRPLDCPAPDRHPAKGEPSCLPGYAVDSASGMLYPTPEAAVDALRDRLAAALTGEPAPARPAPTAFGPVLDFPPEETT